jgi:hypothetical protein
MAAAEVLIVAGCCFLGGADSLRCTVEAKLGKVDSLKSHKKIRAK